MSSNSQERFLLSHSFKLMLMTIAIGVVIRTLWLSSYVIQVRSVQPAVQPGEFILAWKSFAPKRGDVVILPCPQNESSTCIKRVVGLPGDRLEIRKQRLIINAEPAAYTPFGEAGSETSLKEKWRTSEWSVTIDASVPANMPPLVVPPDHVFLLNDRRADLVDSRQWGPIAVSQLEARAWRIWLSINWAQNRLNFSRLLRRID